MREVAVIGVGMTRFGRYEDKSIVAHGVESSQAALKDANLGWKEVQIAYVGAAQQGITPGTRVLAELGITGIPMINVENASATGSTAFREAYLAIATGLYDIALALGVGKMGRAFAVASSPEPAEFNFMKAMGDQPLPPQRPGPLRALRQGACMPGSQERPVQLLHLRKPP